MFDCVLTHIFAAKPFGLCSLLCSYPHFAPFSLDLCSKQYVNGAAMLAGRVVVVSVPTVGVDSSTLHYDEYRSGTCSDIAVKERCSLSD